MLYSNQINTSCLFTSKIPKGRGTMSAPTLIKEDSQSYTKHAQLFKELIHTFIREFLEALFPEVHDSIDFQSITPYSEEFRTDLIEGSTRRLDIVVETKLKETDVVVMFISSHKVLFKQIFMNECITISVSYTINIKKQLFQLLFLVTRKIGKRVRLR